VIELAALIRPTGMPFGVELTLCDERRRMDVVNPASSSKDWECR
jgi:hypothetical protein